MRRLASLLVIASPLLASPARADPPAPAPPLAPAASAAYHYPWTAPAGYTVQRLNGGAMGGGIFLVALGATALGAGTGVFVGSDQTCTILRGNVESHPDCADQTGKRLGMTLLISGAAMIAVGIPLWVYGSERVLRQSPRLATAAPSVLVGPTSAALRWSF